MNDRQNQRDRWEPEGRFPDGISCVGLVLLIIIVLSTLGVSLGSAAADRSSEVAMITDVPSPTLEPTPTENSPAGIRKTGRSATTIPTGTAPIRETAAQTPPPSRTPTETPTETPTDVPMMTPTDVPMPAPSPSPTLIPSPTNTPVPTSTPTATPTATPLPTPYGSFSQTLRVPILMYHYISVPPEGADKYRLDLSVSPDEFQRQMTYLHENGYTTIDLYDLSRAIANRQELPPKPVILTLDDGYRDNYENAFPVLEEYGQIATFFIVTDFVDQGRPEYMTWDMLEEMARAGMNIEPHSKTHPDLRGQDRDYVIYQVLGSRETIEAHLGFKPRYFAYPSGRYDDQVLDIMEELDYWGGVTTSSGSWHSFVDRYEWRRLRIRNVTNLAEFIDLLE